MSGEGKENEKKGGIMPKGRSVIRGQFEAWDKWALDVGIPTQRYIAIPSHLVIAGALR